MPQYATLIYSTDVDWSLPEYAETTAEYGAFAEAAAAAIRGGAALYPTPTATTLHVDGGKGGEIVATDGPYAETKEALTGFYLIEADDLDAAIAIAATIPAAWDGTGRIEVRPTIDFSGGMG
ncbi:MAG: transcription initiation protein [Solirubrobacteraceae bacterium]|nr:transcription initiation protein [Solirubrobacteraceae bacterium]